MTPDSKIFVAGHRGMVGSAIVRALQKQGFSNLLLRTRQEVDLLDRHAVRAFFEKERPEFVVDAAARVGGIIANSEKPVEFLVENLTIQNNVIQAAADFGCAKLLFLGSSCIYPKMAPQPIPESALLTGPLEPTNDAYAIAKIAGIKLCQAYARHYGKNFLSGMPTNLYGPHDNFDLHTSHVLPALIRKVHEAKKSATPEVVVWGTGTPRREFLHADDLAEACVFLLKTYDSPELINIGFGDDVTIRELAETVCEVVGFDGQLVFDTTKPDGTPRASSWTAPASSISAGNPASPSAKASPTPTPGSWPIEPDESSNPRSGISKKFRLEGNPGAAARALTRGNAHGRWPDPARLPRCGSRRFRPIPSESDFAP